MENVIIYKKIKISIKDMDKVVFEKMIEGPYRLNENINMRVSGDDCLEIEFEKLYNEDKLEEAELDWGAAIEYLNMLRETYLEIGQGIFGVILLDELLGKYENGERSKKLYDEIMECQ